VFPSSARSKGISGSVLLEAIIDTKGEVADLRIVRSVQDFDQAALDAVSRWVYTPSVANGVPTEVVMVVTVNFATSRSSPAQGTAAPVPSPNGFGSGMWHGYVPVSLAISQDARKLTVVRQSQVGSDKLTYGLDGKPSTNKVPHAGVAQGDTYTYTSHWDGPQLVTDITWMDPNGLRELKEAFSLEGETLLVTTTRSDQSTGTVPFTQTAAYTRQK
jgi:TonB family protein